METANEEIRKANGLYAAAIKAAYYAVRDYVAENGNFIDTQNTEGICDGMYAYVYDEDFTIQERRIMAVRCKNGNLEIFTAEQYQDSLLVYGRGYMEDSDGWLSMDGAEDVLYTSPTLFGMLDVICEYGN